MKKFTVLLLVMLLSLGMFAACSKDSAEGQSDTDEKVASEESSALGTGAPAEGGGYSVLLKSQGNGDKLAFIKYLKDEHGFTLRDAKNVMESLPYTVFDNFSESQARAAAEELERLGGKVVVLTPDGEDADKVVIDPNGTYTLTLNSYDESKKVEMIKCIRGYLGLNLADGKQYVESLPKDLFTGISGSEAQKVMNELAAFDADITVK